MAQDSIPWYRRTSWIIGMGCFVLAIVAGYRLYASLSDGMGAPGRHYYFDTASKEMFTAAAKNVPPIMRGSNESVRVYMFTCGACSESERFVGFYEKYTPDMQAELSKADDPVVAMSNAANRGLLQSLDGETWFNAGSKESLAILERLQCPSGANAQPCLP